MKKTLILLLLPLLFGCGNDTNSSTPKVASIYKKYMDAAWEVASEGKSPSIACASVMGTALSTVNYGKGNKTEAAQAYEACYVDVFVQYAKVYMSQSDHAQQTNNKPAKGCMALAISYRIHRMALGDSAQDLGLDSNVLAQKLYNNLGDVAVLCPGLTLAD